MDQHKYINEVEPEAKCLENCNIFYAQKNELPRKNSGVYSWNQAVLNAHDSCTCLDS